jgi:hypothetical protein
MRKTLQLICLSLTIIFNSCDNGILEPETEPGNFIGMPENSALADTTKFDLYYDITGLNDYSIEFVRQFVGGPFGQYSISSKLLIQAGTIPSTDTLTCLFSIDVLKTASIVSPLEQYFAHPLKLTITYLGIDLTGLDSTQVQFVYTNENNVLLPVTYDSVSVDPSTGKLEVINALIEFDPGHVADGRYGWIRKAD